MTRALIVTHGSLGQELITSSSAVYAVEAPLDALSNEGHSGDSLREAVAQWLDAESTAAVVMVDVAGGSCAVAALQASADRPDTWVLGGVNLPMVLTFASSHAQLSPADLVAKMLDRALNSVGMLGPTS